MSFSASLVRRPPSWTFYRACAGAAFGIALVVAAGWLFHALFLVGQWPGYRPMAPITALAFLLLSGGIFSYERWSGYRLRQLLALAAAGVPILLAVLSLAEFFAGMDFRRNPWLPRTGGFVGPLHLGRMSPLTAVALLLESAALLLLLRPRRWRFCGSFAAVFAATGAAIGLVFLLGYAYRAPLFHGGDIPVALPTACAIVLVGAGLIHLLWRELPASRIWTSNSTQAILLRAFVPGVLLLVLLDGWLDSMSWTISAVNPALLHSLEAVVFGAAVFALITWTARRTGDAIERAQQALEKSRALHAEGEERFRLAMEATSDGVWDWDIQTDETYFSPAYYRMLGYEVGDFPATGGAWKDLIHPDDRERTLRANMDCIEGRSEQFEVEYRIRTRDEGWRWILARGKCIARDQQGRALRLVGTHVDVTERNRAEQALRESADRLALILEATSGGVWDWNIPSGDAVFSRGYATMLGYDPEEFARNYKSWKGLVHPDDVERVKQHHADHFARGTPFSIEFRMRDRSGAWHWVHSRGLVIERDTEGRPVRMVGTHSDIQERKRAEEERNLLQTQLAQLQKMESIGRLAGGLAHDFGNLMSVILLQGEAALEELRSGDPLVGPLSEIRKAAGKAAALTQQLMAFGRKQPLETRVLDLNSVISESEPMLRRLIGENIHLQIIPGPGLGRVKTQPGQLEQIIMNLAVNARDAMPEGGELTMETANVELDEVFLLLHPAAPRGPCAVLVVTDTGIGMNEEVQQRAFDPFFTTKEVGKGAGLGLSVVYGIVKQSDGYVTVSSQPGRGAEFRIYLPRVLETPEPVVGAETAAPERGVETILVAEDEPAVRGPVCDVLRGAGYRVLAGNDVEEVIQTAGRHDGPIHLLLTDVVMPDMSGPELARHLQPTHPQMKVLYMSAFSEPRIPESPLTSDNFISKPFTKDELLRRLREALEDRKA